MVFHPRACGKYSMVKDTVIFFTEDLAVEFAVVEETWERDKWERRGSGYETKNAFYNCIFTEIPI